MARENNRALDQLNRFNGDRAVSVTGMFTGNLDEGGRPGFRGIPANLDTAFGGFVTDSIHELAQWKRNGPSLQFADMDSQQIGFFGELDSQLAGNDSIDSRIGVVSCCQQMLRSYADSRVFGTRSL